MPWSHTVIIGAVLENCYSEEWKMSNFFANFEFYQEINASCMWAALPRASDNVGSYCINQDKATAIVWLLTFLLYMSA